MLETRSDWMHRRGIGRWGRVFLVEQQKKQVAKMFDASCVGRQRGCKDSFPPPFFFHFLFAQLHSSLQGGEIITCLAVPEEV